MSWLLLDRRIRRLERETENNNLRAELVRERAVNRTLNERITELEANDAAHLEALARANDRATKAEAELDAVYRGKKAVEVRSAELRSERDEWKVKADDYGAKLEDATARQNENAHIAAKRAGNFLTTSGP